MGVDVVHHGFCGVLGAALGHDVGLGKQLHGLDHGNHDDILDGALQAGQGDVQKLLKFRGPVDGGRLVEAGGDALEPGQKDHHLVARALPGRHEDDGVHGGLFVGQEVDGVQPQAHQDGVDQAGVGVGVVEHRPQHGDDHHGGELRSKVHGAEDGHALEPLGHQQGQRQSKSALDRDDDHGEVGRVLQRFPEVSVVEQLGVVIQTGEPHVVRADDMVFEQGVIDGVAHGNHKERDEQDHGGRGEDISGEPLAPLSPGESPFF